MKKDLNHQVNQYLKQIHRSVPHNYEGEKQIMKLLKDNIILFRKENPDATMEDITEEFGTVSEVVDSYLDQYNLQAIIQQMSMKNRLLIIGFALSVFICSVTLFKYYQLSNSHILTASNISYRDPSTERNP